MDDARPTPETWLTDVAVICAAELRRHPVIHLTWMGVLALVLLAADLGTAAVGGLLIGVLVRAITQTRCLGRPDTVSTCVTVAAAVLIVATAVTGFLLTGTLWDAALGERLQPWEYGGGPAVAHQWLRAGFAPGLALRGLVLVLGLLAARAPRLLARGARRRRRHLLGAVACLITLGWAVLPALAGSPLWRNAVTVAAAGLATFVAWAAVRLGVAERRTRWLTALVVALALAILLGLSGSPVLAAVVFGPLVGRTGALVVQRLGAPDGSQAVARLAARFALRPVRATIVACLCAHAAATWIAEVSAETCAWSGWGSDTTDLTSAHVVARSLVPGPADVLILVALAGTRAARGLVERAGAIGIWLALPLAWFLVNQIVAWRDLSLTWLQGFVPMALAALIGAAITEQRSERAQARIVTGLALAAVLVPLAVLLFLVGDEMAGLEDYLGRRRLMRLLTLPALALAGALSVTRVPTTRQLFKLFGIALALVFVMAQIDVGEPILLLAAPGEAMAGALCILGILLARRLGDVTPLPRDHAVFVLGRDDDRAAASGSATLQDGRTR